MFERAGSSDLPARPARAVRRVAAWIVALVLVACAAPPAPAVFDGVPKDERGVVVLYGDVRPRLAAEVWRKDSTRERLAVIDRIADEQPDLVINSGDLVADGWNTADWAQFDRETAPLRERGIPYVAGLGNHDLTGDRDRALGNFYARFPDARRQRWREVRVRDVAFLVLDTNLGALEPEERDAEIRWLDATLDRDEADPSVGTIVLVTHHPPFSNGVVHEASRWVREQVFERAVTRSKVRAVFSGHLHSYERFEVGGVQCVVSGGGGAPLMDVRTERPPYKDAYEGPRSFHFCRITLGTRITCEVVMLGPDGAWTVADRFEIWGGPLRRFYTGSPH